MDFPRAWAIAKMTKIEGHDPRCSYVVGNGGVLCDCYILTRHPEYIGDYGFLKIKEGSRVKDKQDRINQIHSVLGKIVDILSRMNQGANMGDVEIYIDEVQNDLSKMQETG